MASYLCRSLLWSGSQIRSVQIVYPSLGDLKRRFMALRPLLCVLYHMTKNIECLRRHKTYFDNSDSLIIKKCIWVYAQLLILTHVYFRICTSYFIVTRIFCVHTELPNLHTLWCSIPCRFWQTVVKSGAHRYVSQLHKFQLTEYSWPMWASSDRAETI